MITIFNGRQRGDTNGGSMIYAQIDVAMRENIKLFRNGTNLNPFGVFIVIALHANEDGWSWPSTELISDETSLSTDAAIYAAVDHLRGMTLNGKRVLDHYRIYKNGKWGRSYYHLFPESGGSDKPPCPDLIRWTGKYGNDSEKPVDEKPLVATPLVETPGLSLSITTVKETLGTNDHLDSKDTDSRADSSRSYGAPAYPLLGSGIKPGDSSFPGEESVQPTIKQLTPGKRYPVSDVQKLIWLKPYSKGEAETNAEGWRIKGYNMITGSAINKDPKYTDYVRQAPPRPRHLVYDAFAIGLWGMEPGFDNEALNGGKKNGGSVGKLVAAYGALVKKDYGELANDAIAAADVAQFCKDYMSTNGDYPLRNPESFTGEYNFWIKRGKKPKQVKKENADPLAYLHSLGR